MDNGILELDLEDTSQPEHVLFRDYSNPTEYDFIAIFYCQMDRPLAIWDKQNRGSGRIFRGVDKDSIHSLQILQHFYATQTYITTPRQPFSSLGIKLEWITFVMMSIKKSVTVTVQIKDDIGLRRKFIFRNNPQRPENTPLIAYGHLNFVCALEWNQLQFDLGKATMNTFGTRYVETTRVQVSPSCRLRLIYFSAHPLDIEEALIPLRKSLDVIGQDINGDRVAAKRKTYLLVPSFDAAFVPTLAEHNRRHEIEARVAIYNQPPEKRKTAEVQSSARVIIHPGRIRPQTVASPTPGPSTATSKQPHDKHRPYSAYP